MEMTEKDLNAVEQSKSNRRSAIMLGGAALAGLAFHQYAEAQSTVTDADILNFALNLEYLEAQYYTLATSGKTIDQVGVGITGPSGAAGGSVVVKANPLVPFTTPLLQQYAMETALEERNHVTFLRTALGASAVAQPNLDLQNSFNALAVAAGLGSSFDPFANETNFLLGAFIFEDVGVTAYHGAAGLISDKTYLSKAAGILAIEAYHAGSIRTRIFAAGSAVQAIASKIAATRATLDGTGNDDVGVGITASGASTVVNADANAIAFSRTTTQVLKVVYGGGTSSGAFFPNGMNGTIK